MKSSRDLGLRPLTALLKRAREAVFVLDADRRFAYVNPAWEALTGFGAEEVVGLECQPHGPSRDGDLAGLGGSFCPTPESLAGQPSGGTTLIVRRDGSRHWCRVEFWPYHDERGRLIGLVGQVRESNATPHAPDSGANRLRAELLELRERLRGRYGIDNLIGVGPGHRRLLDQIAAAAMTDVPVLILGEPGTGKRTVARTIHQRRRDGSAPLIPFDCAALPAEVLERELFADDGEGPGPRLALPEGATVLLIDALDLPRDFQGRLASALGGGVRLLATTSIDADQALRSDRLRPDLYFALTTFAIRLPCLRDRLEDLPLLAQHLLERASLRSTRRRAGFTPEALATLSAYDWPGNLRELGRVIESAQERGDGDLIEVEDLPAAIRGHFGSAYTPPPMPPPVTPLDELMTQMERKLIEQALQRARQNKSRAAELLDISRPRLYRRIKELSIPDVPEPDDEPVPPAESRA